MSAKTATKNGLLVFPVHHYDTQCYRSTYIRNIQPTFFMSSNGLVFNSRGGGKKRKKKRQNVEEKEEGGREETPIIKTTHSVTDIAAAYHPRKKTCTISDCFSAIRNILFDSLKSY